MKKYVLAALLIIVLGIAAFAYSYYPRLSFSLSLFTGAEQYENFNRIDELFPVSKLPESQHALEFARGESQALPKSFRFRGNEIATQEFLERTDTAALLVLKDGKITFEQYWLTGAPDEQWLSMSVAKSFISALVGIAISEGKISSIQDDIASYVPQLTDTAYAGVRIKDILQMSSGASWNENYSDPDSDINRFSRVFALGGSLDEFTASLTKDFEPGSRNRYNSIDTQTLGMLIREATGMSVTQYMIEKLWKPMGAQDKGFWIVDDENMEMAFAGLAVTARDYAKIGELYRNKGRLNGKQIVPEKWVKASITPDGPHLMPGENPLSDYPMGYGFQWWIPDLESGDFSAIGVYNQFVYVAPKANMVAVKLSANSIYGTSIEASSDSEFESVAFFKAIAKQEN